MVKDADYIIVGGGTAGCTLATRLKQNLPAASVVLLEAGNDEHQNPLISEMMGTFQLHFTDLEYKYTTVPQKNYDNRQVFNAGGKVLSGSSACNYGMWTRGSKADYDIWADAAGDDRWSYDSLLPYFKRTETYHDSEGVDKDQHGSSGPLHTTTSRDRPYPLKEDLINTFLKTTGLAWNPDPNAGNPLGIAPYTENWRDGKRQPAGLAYGLAGVSVSTGTIVKRILIEGQSAVGVELVNGEIIKAMKEVIISCGALRSPQVLKLSGVGPRDELAALGIRPELSNDAAKNVGANLSDHVAVPIFYEVKNPEAGVAAGAPGWNHPEFLLGMPASMIVTANNAGEELKAAMIRDGQRDVTDDHPYLRPNRGHSEIIPVYAATEPPLTDLGLPFDGSIITSGVLCLLPTSRGSVKLSGTQPDADPLIDPNYFSTETDKTVIRQAVRMNLKAFETAPLADHIAGQRPPPGYEQLTTRSTDADVDAYVKRVAGTWFHPSGTCAMGKVVDAECKVLGLKGLRVVDASVFPNPLTAHYQAPVYALAEKVADMMIKDAA